MVNQSTVPLTRHIDQIFLGENVDSDNPEIKSKYLEQSKMK
jgi:hypothetical protein